MGTEDGQEVCDLLTKMLQKCDGLQDIAEMEYDFRREIVYIKYTSGLRKVVDVHQAINVPSMLIAIIACL